MSREEYRRGFAKRLRYAMQKRGVGAYVLAGQMDVNPTTVYDYLNGDAVPKADSLADMCEALDVDANELLGVRR